MLWKNYLVWVWKGMFKIVGNRKHQVLHWAKKDEWRRIYCSSRVVVFNKFGNMEIQILLMTEVETIEKEKLLETLPESQVEWITLSLLSHSPVSSYTWPLGKQEETIFFRRLASAASRMQCSVTQRLPEAGRSGSEGKHT